MKILIPLDLPPQGHVQYINCSLSYRHGFWKPNSIPVEEQEMFLFIESYIQSQAELIWGGGIVCF